MKIKICKGFTGLFIFTSVVLTFGLERSGFAAALALTILMLPVVIRTSEEMLRLVPNDLRSQSRTDWRTPGSHTNSVQPRFTIAVRAVLEGRKNFFRPADPLAGRSVFPGRKDTLSRSRRPESARRIHDGTPS